MGLCLNLVGQPLHVILFFGSRSITALWAAHAQARGSIIE